MIMPNLMTFRGNQACYNLEVVTSLIPAVVAKKGHQFILLFVVPSWTNRIFHFYCPHIISPGF